MRSNPLSRGAVSVTLGHSRERRREASPRRHRHDRRACAARGRLGGARDDHVSRRAAAGCGATASRAHAREHAGPLRSRRRPLARERQRALQRPLDDRRLGAVARRGRRKRKTSRIAASPEAASEPRLAASAIRPGSGLRTGSAIASRGKVRDLRASFVRSPELRIPLRAIALAGSPPIVPRSAWGARRVDPPRRALLRRRDPVRQRAPHGGTNAYSPSQAAAIMRGIEVYHVKSNGWNDIGYNFLVDRTARLEGRYGGSTERDRRARARFNTGSVGVAVIGTFGTPRSRRLPRRPSRSCSPGGSTSRTSIPSRTLTFVSGGSERYNAGVPGRASRRLGAPRHGTTRLPGKPPLREARHDRREDGGDRAAEALRAEGHRGRRRDGPVPGTGLLGAALEGAHQRRPRAAAR